LPATIARSVEVGTLARRFRVTPPPGQRAIWFAPSQGTFSFIDLFAGIGGMRLGLQRAGGQCVYAAEIDRFARRTYIRNFGACEGDDVRDVPADALPDYDLLAAGFPCQPFSIAGVSKKASLGRRHGSEDEKSGNLFFEIERLLRGGPRPRVVLLENVRNLRSHDSGRTFAEIRRRLDNLGYELTDAIIDAQHWVPQHRERIFIVGMLRSVYGGRQFHFPTVPTDLGPRLGTILEQPVDERFHLSSQLWSYLQAYKAKHQARGNGFGFGLVGSQGIARTLSARYHKDGSEILIETERNTPRRLTPRECARLMGFPEEFEICVSDTQAYRQFGNAVVVDVVQFVAEEIVRQAGLGKVLAATG
jgi:DNA (cytosine-5)-methyltransferase 1